MGNEAYPVKLSGTATTTLGSVRLFGIAINKITTGTLVVEDGTTALANFAASTAVGMYHTVPNGVRYANLQLVLSANDDVTVFIAKA